MLDFGGTIYEELGESERAVMQAVEELGVKPLFAGYSRGYGFFGFRSGGVCEASMRGLAYYLSAISSGGRVDVAFAEKLYEAMSERLASMLKPLPGALEFIRRVKGLGVKLALVSNASSHEAIVRALERDGVLELFDAIVTSVLVCVRKPDSRIFNYALALLGVKASEAVFIGDRAYEDVLGARSVGMKTIHLTRSEPPSPLADYAVSSLDEAYEVLERLTRE